MSHSTVTTTIIATTIIIITTTMITSNNIIIIQLKITTIMTINSIIPSVYSVHTRNIFAA